MGIKILFFAFAILFIGLVSADIPQVVIPLPTSSSATVTSNTIVITNTTGYCPSGYVQNITATELQCVQAPDLTIYYLNSNPNSYYNRTTIPVTNTFNSTYDNYVNLNSTNNSQLLQGYTAVQVANLFSSIFLYNQSTPFYNWLGGFYYNYNQTYTGGTYNVSYNTWLSNYTLYSPYWYNQSFTMNWTNIVLTNISNTFKQEQNINNITYPTNNFTLKDSDNVTMSCDQSNNCQFNGNVTVKGVININGGNIGNITYITYVNASGSASWRTYIDTDGTLKTGSV